MSVAAKILTVSDGVAAGTRVDSSGSALEEFLRRQGMTVVDRRLSPDGRGAVATVLVEMSSDFHGLVLTTGGSGFGPRDETPEATLDVVVRIAPGLTEAMRAVNPLGRLSRGVAGIRGRALIVNLPGSPAGSLEQLAAVIDVLPHAVALLTDNSDPHPSAPR